MFGVSSRTVRAIESGWLALGLDPINLSFRSLFDVESDRVLFRSDESRRDRLGLSAMVWEGLGAIIL